MKPLMPLIEEGKCVPIVNVGSPDGTRSHFSAQDYMERGCTGENKLINGWLNRYLEATRKPYDAPLRGLCAMSLLPAPCAATTPCSPAATAPSRWRCSRTSTRRRTWST